MTDFSISDIKGISYSELDQKIDRLASYLTKVQQRLDVLYRKQHIRRQAIDDSVTKQLNQKGVRRHVTIEDQR